MIHVHNSRKPWPRIAGRMSAVLERPWLSAIVRKSAVEDSLGVLHPLLSLTEVRAQVVRIIDETATTKTFVLQPNAHWQGAESGQFVRLQTEINGRRIERAYSISSRGGARRIAITVKKKEGGAMSNFLHCHARVGSVFTLSQADGEFVLRDSPDQQQLQTLPRKILLLSAGSGITPVMSMLRELEACNYDGDLVFLHACRNPADLIFSHQLHEFAAYTPGLRLVTHFTEPLGRLTTSALLAHVPDLGERATWMCGPAEWMESIHGLWRDNAYLSSLRSERFGGAPVTPTTVGTSVAVTFVRSGKHFSTEGAQPLLAQAERVGLAPKHGCRIGICRSCQCIKKSGTVENLLTGELSSAPNEQIRLCVSTARSDVTLDL